MKIRGWLLGGFLFVLGVVFVFLMLQLDRINIGLASVGSRLNTLETASAQRMADPAQVAKDLAALGKDLQQLRTELATVQGRISSVEAANQVSGVKESLDVVQTELASLRENLTLLQNAILSVSQQIEALIQNGADQQGANSTSLSGAQQAALSGSGDSCAWALEWTSAPEFAGKNVIRSFSGPVVAAIHAASGASPVTVLHIGSHGPERLQPWIAEVNRARFVSAPEELFAGKTVCVTGVIEWQQNGAGENIASIELTGPQQISIIK